MKLTLISNIMNCAFQYVINTSKRYNIDESHALKHSMDVLHYSNKIYQSELTKNPYLKDQKEIIFASCILHDMCDKKYMNEEEGVLQMRNYMKGKMSTQDLNIISDIISTMSYSKVMKKGYPDLDKYQLSYHIVRESDLLTAYDLERCIIYQMMHENYTYYKSLEMAINLFDNRVLRYIQDNLFITDYSKLKAEELHFKALQDIENIKTIL
jgi:HD superfamily phosphodiesterase